MSNEIKNCDEVPAPLIEEGSIYYREEFDNYYTGFRDHTTGKTTLVELNKGWNYGHAERCRTVPHDVVQLPIGSCITLTVA